MNFDELNTAVAILGLLAALNVPSSVLAVALWAYIFLTEH